MSWKGSTGVVIDSARELMKGHTPHNIGDWTALSKLTTSLGLTPFERAVLAVCVGTELDEEVRELCRHIGGRDELTFAGALQHLPEPGLAALSPSRPLRRWSLVEVQPGSMLTTAGLRIDERVLHYLLGVSAADERLAGLVRVERAADDEIAVAPGREQISRNLADLLERTTSDGLDSVMGRMVLAGGSPVVRRRIALAAAGFLGAGLSCIRAQDLPSDPAERIALIRLWERQAVLEHVVLLLEVDDGDSVPSAFEVEVAAPLVISSRDEAVADPRVPVLAVPLLNGEQRRALLVAALPDASDAELEPVLSRLRLDDEGVMSAARATAQDLDAGQGPLGAALWKRSREIACRGLSDLGMLIEPIVGWSDIVLPERQLALLHELHAQVSNARKVLDDWGFGARSSRGHGVTALFAGPSGCGKTLAAEVIAAELGLSLLVIDLSQVVSKYIGETEKNLARVFEAGESGGAVLLFDEADALFGKRSQVTDSHDRYANIEVGYLLQRMEAYTGLAILTTNLKDSLDEAFLRRLRFVVNFPFPDAPQRALIWSKAFPSQTPLAGVSAEMLATLAVPGGSIRNIALSAAFLGAADGGRVGMPHLLAAARTELEKLGRIASPAELAGWS